MNLPVIEMPRTEARRKFLEYRTAVKERHDDELHDIMLGYRAMSLGKRLISLQETLRSSGTVHVTDQWYDSGFGYRNYTAKIPALAIARADQTLCKVKRENTRFWMAPEFSARMNRSTCFTFPDTTKYPNNEFIRSTWKAMVPLVPANLRPKHHLRNYHILWEAKWTREKPLAPEDPALLKRISKDLFVVLAVWDLTPLERAVLGAR